jgi:hypothetical protein
MTTDVQGCSTCPRGEERHEEFRWGDGRVSIQYDYRAPDGELYSTIGPTLEMCRAGRDRWLGGREGSGQCEV